MKNRLLISSILFLFVSCEKHMPKSHGTISATKNGELWAPLIAGNLYNDGSLELRMESFYGSIRIEALYFDHFPKQVGLYHLSNTPGMRIKYRTLDHDAVCDPYKSDTTDITPDFLDLISIGFDDKKMTGKFQCSFNFDTTGGRTKCNPNAPDKIVINCTGFETKIVKIN